MSIIRAPRKESNFYVLDKKISEDKRIGWAARGLLIYLLGKPDNWVVSVDALRGETRDSSNPTGRDGVYRLINELISAGYIERKFKHVGGRADGYEYFVSETPAQFPENQDTENQFTELTTLISTEVKQELKESKDAGRPATRARAKKEEVTIQDWMQTIKESGQRFIPSTDTIWTDGVPDDFIQLAWKVFEESMTEKGAKKKDWRAQFRTYVRNDYLRLWAINRAGDYYLTTAGKQAAQRFGMGDLIDG